MYLNAQTVRIGVTSYVVMIKFEEKCVMPNARNILAAEMLRFACVLLYRV